MERYGRRWPCRSRSAITREQASALQRLTATSRWPGHPEPMSSAEVGRQPVVHAAADRDLKAVQQAKGHLRERGVLFIERNCLAEVLGGRRAVPLEPLSGYGGLDFVQKLG